MPLAATTAVLLDIDGTLVDSNYLHVAAWHEGFAAVGETVAQARIHRGIGMGTPQLLAWLVGEQRAGEVEERVSAVHRQRYADAARLLRPLPGAREIVRALHGQGVRTILATSASPEELERLLAVLDLGDAVDAVTSADDVVAAKPEPDVVERALEKAGVTAAEAVFVGDTRWDVEAAGKAGVETVGVRSGGIGAAELREAGAVAVYDDPAHLLSELGSSPLARLLP